jgi:hypothetical protein
VGTKFSEWAQEQKARETPAQAGLRRRFEVVFQESSGHVKISRIPGWARARIRYAVTRGRR